jgi:outer membrane receptor protein involved in Fe transport
MARKPKKNFPRSRPDLPARSKLSCAIATILGSSSAAYFATAHAADTGASSDRIEEIIVTAQRRSENIQNVPIAIQALTSETLTQLNVARLDDFVRYLPNVTAPSSGPGQSQVFMRGLSVGSDGVQSGGSISGFPNVAIYLDDQSGQLPSRNLDVYAADLERVEVLEGPQGTLFGAGAQAGAVRYITNKPRLNVTEGSVTAGYGTTSGGDPNSELTGVINLPLIADKLAVRAVIYNDHHGGYIDNVPSTFTRKDSDLGIHYAYYATACDDNSLPSQGTCTTGNPSAFGVPPGSPVINNYAIAKKAINPVTYQGMRASALWNFHDEWSALLTQSYQDIDAQGVFYQMPNSSDGAPLPRQSVTLFNDSFNKDKFTNTALAVNGRIGDLKAVYTGSYLLRNVSQVQDYTNYARGVYADYYQCHGAEPGLAATCFSPSSTWNDTERNTHQSHEMRLSTPDDWRLRGIVGAFWEKLVIEDQLNWQYKTLPACTASVTTGCLTNIAPSQGGTVSNPATRNDNVAFFNDVTRGYKQRAFFMSVDYDLIPKVLTLTAGTRYYHFDNTEKGAVTGSFGCYEAGPAPCPAPAFAVNIDDANLHTTYQGFKSRANLTWHFLPDALVYATWSQGFRPGGFNRFTACYVPDPVSGISQYCSPYAFASDNLTNKEIGWKTEFLDHRLQWNGAVYQEDWQDVQINLFNPGVLGNIGFGTNGPSYRIRGVETSFVAVLTAGLTAQGGMSWNSSEQTNSPYLIANNPELLADPTAKALYGQPITNIKNPYGPLGTPSANSPPFQFNLRLRYQWSRNSYNAFVQAGATHTAHSFTQSGVNPALSTGGSVSTTLIRFENLPYSQYDASAGLSRDAWTAELYAQNLTNVNASVFTSTTQFVPAQTITRPRVMGIKLGYEF